MKREPFLALALALTCTVASSCSHPSADQIGSSAEPEDPEPTVSAEPATQSPSVDVEAPSAPSAPEASPPDAREDGCGPGTACAQVPQWWDAHGENGWVEQELEIDEPWTAEQRDATGRALHPTLQEIATCFDALKTEQPTFRGRMDVTMTIAVDGSVRAGRASTPSGAGFRDCALAALRRARIDAPTYTGEVQWGIQLY